MIPVQALIVLVVQIVVIGVIVSLLWWLIDQAGLPVPFARAAHIILAVIAVLIVCGLLLSVVGVGPPLFRWG